MKFRVLACLVLLVAHLGSIAFAEVPPQIGPGCPEFLLAKELGIAKLQFRPDSRVSLSPIGESGVGLVRIEMRSEAPLFALIRNTPQGVRLIGTTPPIGSAPSDPSVDALLSPSGKTVIFARAYSGRSENTGTGDEKTISRGIVVTTAAAAGMEHQVPKGGEIEILLSVQDSGVGKPFIPLPAVALGRVPNEQGLFFLETQDSALDPASRTLYLIQVDETVGSKDAFVPRLLETAYPQGANGEQLSFFHFEQLNQSYEVAMPAAAADGLLVRMVGDSFDSEVVPSVYRGLGTLGGVDFYSGSSLSLPSSGELAIAGRVGASIPTFAGDYGLQPYLVPLLWRNQALVWEHLPTPPESGVLRRVARDRNWAGYSTVPSNVARPADAPEIYLADFASGRKIPLTGAESLIGRAKEATAFAVISNPRWSQGDVYVFIGTKKGTLIVLELTGDTSFRREIDLGEGPILDVRPSDSGERLFLVFDNGRIKSLPANPQIF